MQWTQPILCLQCLVSTIAAFLAVQVDLDTGSCDLPPFQLSREQMVCTLPLELEGHASVSAKLKVQLSMGDAVDVQPHEQAISCKLGHEVELPMTVSFTFCKLTVCCPE